MQSFLIPEDPSLEAFHDFREVQWAQKWFFVTIFNRIVNCKHNRFKLALISLLKNEINILYVIKITCWAFSVWTPEVSPTEDEFFVTLKGLTETDKVVWIIKLFVFF